MKLCKDCKWAHRGWLDIFFLSNWKYAKCANPNTESYGGETNPVTGVVTPVRDPFCENARIYDTCGPEGKLFEAK